MVANIYESIILVTSLTKLKIKQKTKMKKIALALAMAGLAVSSYGQGYVTVAGTQQNTTIGTIIDNTWAGGLLAGGTVLQSTTQGGAYSVELLTSTAANPMTTLFGSGAALGTTWQDTGLLGHNNTFAGRLTIGSGLVANNAPVGSSQSWLLVAWSSNLGANWSAVSSQLASGNFGGLSGYVGWSTVGVASAAAAPPVLPTVIQGTGGVITSPYTLLATPVPEPTTLALAALGGASLLLFRRRK